MYQKFPILGQLLLIFALAVAGSMVGALITQGIGQAMGVNYFELIQNMQNETDSSTKNLIRVALCFSHLFTFILPSLLFLWLVHKKNWMFEAKLTQNPKLNLILLSTLFLACSFPIAQYSFFWNQKIPLPDWAIQQESTINETISQLLKVESLWGLAFNIFTIAFLPAIGEELLFRGIVQQSFEKWFKNSHAAVWVSAILFSAMHGQFQGFLPRVILGAVLGYLLVWTRNLWFPIIAHFINNAGQVVLQYFFKEKITDLDIEKVEQIPLSAVLVSALFMGLIGFQLYQKRVQNPKN